MTTNPKKYKPLSAGDTRQEGDEYRHKDGGTKSVWGHAKDRPIPGDWKKVTMFGETILPSDLIVTDFRRPIK